MYPNKELISEIYKEFNSVVKKKYIYIYIYKIILKWAKDLNRHFSKLDNQGFPGGPVV